MYYFIFYSKCCYCIFIKQNTRKICWLYAYFMLDFLRSGHTNTLISVNQIVCLIFIIVSIIMIRKNNNVIYD